LPEEKEAKTKGAAKNKDAAKAPKKGEKAPPAEKKPIIKRDENFRYIVRIVNTDLDGAKNIVIALTSVKGVGMRSAEVIARMAGIQDRRPSGIQDRRAREACHRIL
jgi:hypothetical protein